ncbi:uncharacterized protein LOC132406725 isoform X2 [Hypanus sabinus]|uniref:uncharacterized protein LOC132406725 isoform X2 n=1 Tax=Hypanus sabinus TaxID=79690 RepID=UPI0028C426E0|nr:uncharacterized protein LOC132406725 isoform X2 [Hypanus sabinus]
MAIRTVLASLIELAVLSAVSSNSVTQLPSNETLKEGETMKFFCAFRFVRKDSNVQVRWWKDGESSFLDPNSDRRFSFKKRNYYSSAFDLQNVSASDSGRYFCGVRYESKWYNGTGTTLVVLAPLNLPQITSTPVPKGSSAILRLVCSVARSQSRELVFAWLVNNKEVRSGAEPHVEPLQGSLFRISSSYEVVGQARNATVYTCQVTYPGNKVLKQNYTYISGAAARQAAGFPWWIYVCLASAVFILLLLVTVICLVCKRKRRRDEYRSVPKEMHMQIQPGQRMAPRGYAKGTVPNVYQKPRCPHVPPRRQKGYGKAIYAAPQFKQR